MALLDEIVFKREGFVFVGDEDVFEVDGFAHEGAGLNVGLGCFEQVRADSRAEVVGLADIDDLALGVFVEVDAWLGWKRANFFVEVH